MTVKFKFIKVKSNICKVKIKLIIQNVVIAQEVLKLGVIAQELLNNNN